MPLRETAKPAVLPELGYMDNFSENQQIRDSHYQDKLVCRHRSGFKNITLVR